MNPEVIWSTEDYRIVVSFVSPARLRLTVEHRVGVDAMERDQWQRLAVLRANEEPNLIRKQDDSDWSIAWVEGDIGGRRGLLGALIRHMLVTWERERDATP